MPAPRRLSTSLDTRADPHKLSQVKGTALARPVVPEVNMITAVSSPTNTCDPCSAKWMMLSTASWRAMSSRRRATCCVDARPNARVVRACVAASVDRVANDVRACPPLPFEATPEISSETMDIKDAALASSMVMTTNPGRTRCRSAKRARFSASVRRLLSATRENPPYAAANSSSTNAGEFGRSTATAAPRRTPRRRNRRAMPAENKYVSRNDRASTAPASST